MKIVTRAAACSLLFVAMTGYAQVPAADEEADFCERLASNAGIEKTKVVDGNTVWKSNALNFGQRVLLGGSASTYLGVEPVEPLTVEGYKRAEAMCEAEEKGAVCRLEGPVVFTFGWKGTRTETKVRPDEQALVIVKGTKASCHSGVLQLPD
ncbi:MAG: hypothetical protein QNI87_06215 [Erythrobacter sp.]|uniref:hypothetical protein n=1 Tax=Erythrobacter sp. TaxID=1042 RepID=UPI0026223878|nr:hypothetical protein [Erythrobacter sp.]MDJ0978110.1 hypothetical protein [Erythrobacter sp.]